MINYFLGCVSSLHGFFSHFIYSLHICLLTQLKVLILTFSVRLGPDCHQSCPDRTYSDHNNMVCAPCPDEHCAVCDQSQCYWCDEAFFVFGNC